MSTVLITVVEEAGVGAASRQIFNKLVFLLSFLLVKAVHHLLLNI
jgi:hypothetical protein